MTDRDLILLFIVIGLFYAFSPSLKKRYENIRREKLRNRYKR